MWFLSGNKLTRNLLGNIQPQLSQLAEPLWTDPGIKSGISVCELISTLKKNAGGEWMVKLSLKKFLLTRKKPAYHHQFWLEDDHQGMIRGCLFSCWPSCLSQGPAL